MRSLLRSMLWSRRRAFTMLEALIAGLILSTFLAGTYSMMTGSISGVKLSHEVDEVRQDVRNSVEVIRSLGFDELLLACGSKNPCTSSNSAVNSLLPGELQGVEIVIQFEDESGNLSSEPTFARIRIKGADLRDYFTGIAQSLDSPMSNYGATISGTVTDDLGLPVQGASVVISRPDGTVVDTVITDAAGKYNRRLNKDTYNIVVHKTHYATVSQNNVALDASQVIDFMLERRFTVSGKIVDDTGAPIQGVSISLTGPGGNYSTTTAASGNYTIPNVRPGTYSVSLSKTTYESKSGISLPMNSHPNVVHDNVLERRITLTGTIKNDASGNPVLAGATVKLVGQGRNETKTTNAAGVYTFTDVKPGTYTIEVSSPGHDTHTNTYNIQSHPVHTQNFILQRTTIDVYGTVTNEVGQPVAGATVTLRNGPGGTYTATTNASGNYTISGVIYGVYDITATAIGHNGASLTGVSIATKPSQRVDLQVTRQRINVSGTVRNDAGQPVSGATVHLARGSLTYTAMTDATGKYTINSVIYGSYDITVTAVGHDPHTGNYGITTVPSQTVDFTINRTLIYVFGNVKNEIGQNVNGAKVSLTGGPGGSYSATTDSSGNYAIPNVVYGTYNVEVTATGYATLTKVESITNAPNQRLDVVIHRARILVRGSVKGNLGENISGATVTLSGGPGGTYTTTTNLNGQYSIPDVLYGTYTIDVSAPTYKSKTFPNQAIATVPEQTLNFVLDRDVVTIQGKVTNEVGTAVSGATVTVSGGPSGLLSTTTNATGDYTLTNVIVGTYTLTVSAVGHDTKTLTNQQFTTNRTINVTINRSRITVTGNVRNEGGQNVSGATVTLSGGPGGTYAATTNSSGNYTIADVLYGTYTMTVTATGHDAWTLSGVAIQTTPTQTQNVTLNRSRITLSGYVRNEVGTGINGATVSVSGGPGGSYSATTNSSGYYSISGIIYGTYTVSASAYGHDTSTTTGVAITSVPNQSRNITLNRSVITVNGQVRDNFNNPVSGATVQLSGGPGGTYSTTTNASGNYSIANVKPGNYTLSVSKSGYYSTSRSVAATTYPTQTENVTLTMITYTVSGTVTHTETGMIIADATVTLSGGPGGTYTVQTSSIGTYSIGGVVPGNYQLRVSKADYEDYITTVSISGNTAVNVQLLKSKILWIGTNNGLIAVDANKAEHKRTISGQTRSVVVDPQGNAYVFHNNGTNTALRKFTPAGVLAWTKSQDVSSVRAADISADGNTIVYYGSDRQYHWITPDGTQRRVSSPYYDLEYQYGVFDLAVLNDGSRFSIIRYSRDGGSSTGTITASVYSPETLQWYEWNDRDDNPEPNYNWTDYAATIVLADSDHNYFYVIDWNGNSIEAWKPVIYGTMRSLETRISLRDIPFLNIKTTSDVCDAVYRNNALYLWISVNSTTGRIIKLDVDGILDGSITQPSSPAKGWSVTVSGHSCYYLWGGNRNNSPIDVDEYGYIYVGTSGNKVLKLSPDGKTILWIYDAGSRVYDLAVQVGL